MILITGSSGKLGKELVKLFPDSLTPSHREMDLTHRDAVFHFIRKHKPSAVLHLAALTDVVACEKRGTAAYRINVVGTENLIDALLMYQNDAHLVFMSTAGIFYGDRGNYSESDLPRPKNFYSMTKLLGEFVVKRMKRHLIIRGNFIPRETWAHPKAFTDRWGTYLFVDDFAAAFSTAVRRKMRGVLHIVGDKKLSMFQVARLTNPNVHPTTLKKSGLPFLAADLSLTSIRMRPRHFSIP